MFRLGAACLVAGALVSGFWGCGTSAVGTDECRTLEYARCSAGQYCNLRIDSATKLTECDNFARDNCLHGLASGQAPRPTEVNDCVAAIKAAGSCAHRQGAKTLATDCSNLYGGFAKPSTTVCDVVLDPESTSECGFLTETPVTPDAQAPAPTDAGSD